MSSILAHPAPRVVSTVLSIRLERLLMRSLFMSLFEMRRTLRTKFREGAVHFVQSGRSQKLFRHGPFTTHDWTVKVRVEFSSRYSRRICEW